MASALRVDHSPEAMRGVLQGLYGWATGPYTELIEVSIKSPRGKWHAQHWNVEVLTDPETLKTLAWWSEQGREIYMGCVGLTDRPQGGGWRRGGAKLRGHAGALWLDVDCEAPGREGSEYFATVDEAVEVVDTCLGTTLAGAALVVGSGWGVQYWIPLWEPVPAQDASRMVRALVGWVHELSCKQIDRVWDITRVMRMPGTMNWRAGPDEDEARPTGVIRWPGAAWQRGARLSIQDVTAVLGDVVSDVLGVPRLDPELDRGSVVDALLERYAPGGESGTGPDRPYVPLGEVLGDLDRLAQEVLEWGDVLEPEGWRCISQTGREQVWQRPGKLDEDEAGDRSAVVYSDRPELLVVYSDSPKCGFSTGLRGSGRRGTAAGVGVISKWRAWVDLAWAGDEDRARRSVRDAGAPDAESDKAEADAVAEKVGRAWRDEMDWVEDWGRDLEWVALGKKHQTTVEDP